MGLTPRETKTTWPAESVPPISVEMSMQLHGKPVTQKDVQGIERWGSSAKPVLAKLQALDHNARKGLQRKYDEAQTMAIFFSQRLRDGDGPHFTYLDYALWDERRPKPKKNGSGRKPVSECTAEEVAVRQQSWGKTRVGGFSSCFSEFPCLSVDDGTSVGLAIVPVGGKVDSAPQYCLVYRHHSQDPAYSASWEAKDHLSSSHHASSSTHQAHIEAKPPIPIAVSNKKVPALEYPCVPHRVICGTERDNEWILNAISFLDGMTSVPHEHHIGEINPDAHSPSVLQAARNKLAKEALGYRFLTEDHTPVGYASLWRVSLDYCNDLYSWIKGHGMMRHEKAALGIEPWQPPMPPSVWIGYISSLRIHPRCRYNPEDEHGFRARHALFRGVVSMLEDYAKLGHFFTELIFWTTHVHERDFLRDLRGDHPLEAGENNNIVRLRLLPLPMKGGAFSKLNKLYIPYRSLLTEASEKLRRQQVEETLFSSLDGK